MKTKDWQYENEWRCVRRFNSGESRDVDMPYRGTKEVIFGWKMEDHHVSRILLLAHGIEVMEGHKIGLSESAPLLVRRRIEHHPSNRTICEECGGSGHVIRKPATAGIA